MAESKRNHFPPTLHTWIGAQLNEGTSGRTAINRHVMEAYEEPLRIYFLGSGWRNLGEPHDIINGFLADRLDRAEFFSKWQSSGKRLRHWLINALHFYLKERWRAERRHDSTQLDASTSESHGDVDEPAVHDDVIEQTWARSIVATACRDAQTMCSKDGLESHWQLFLRHHIDGLPYRQCAAEFGVDPKRCAVMARTAASRFREALQQRLRQDGVSELEIDEELMRLQEVIA